MSDASYAEIEKHLPTMVRSELQTDQQQSLFTEEFAPKRKTKLKAYLFLLFLSAHRWYLSGKPGLTVLQWVLNLCYGIGLLWIIWDIFQIPKLVRTRNHQIAKTILSEQRILSGAPWQSPAQPTSVTVNNSLSG